MIANILGPDGLIIIVLAVLVLFGVNKLPTFARNVGAARMELRKAQREAGEAEAAAAKSPGERIILNKSDLEALLRERDL